MIKLMTAVNVSKRPNTLVRVLYQRETNEKNSRVKINDMFHEIHHPDGAAIITNMVHLKDDVMTSGLFSALRVQIEHQIEVERKLAVAIEGA